MISHGVMRRGRPFRALLGLAALFGLWLGWRMPLIGARLDVVTGLLVPRLAAVPLAHQPVAPASPTAPPLSVKAPTARPPRASLPVTVDPLPATPTRLPPPIPPARIETAAPPATAISTSPPSTDSTAFRLAQSAYDRLRAGQRRQAAALFDAALHLQPDNTQWQSDRAALGRRWQLGGFALVRDGGGAGNLPVAAASPVLGGGQLGGSIAFLPDPYARRPLALVLRGNMAADPAGIRRETAQAAIGVRQSLAPGVSISAERLIAIGSATRADWTLRLAVGASHGRLNAYGEAGVLGNGQLYGGAQASARLLRIGQTTLDAASWASLQTGVPDVWRVDLGPSVSTRWHGIRLQADWRQRIAGNAAPGSGPAVTISTGF